MNILSRKKIVLLGMMSRIPVAGEVWGTVQYLLGFERLGYEVYYVEAHGRTPSMLMEREDDDSSAKAAAFIDEVMRRFDLGDHWAYQALHADGRYHGMSEGQLKELYGSAALIINHHGGTEPLPEHSATGRLIYLETDPVELEIELYNNDPKAIAFLAPHCAFFSWGLNYGHADCQVPLSERFRFRPTRQPVLMDLWEHNHNGAAETFTTVGNWRQRGQVKFKGEVYTWSKHHEFLKFLDLPRRTSQAFELALSSGSYDAADQRLIESNGWRLRDALEFSRDLDAYRNYVTASRGEFTVAKGKRSSRPSRASTRITINIAVRRPHWRGSTSATTLYSRNCWPRLGFKTREAITACRILS